MDMIADKEDGEDACGVMDAILVNLWPNSKFVRQADAQRHMRSLANAREQDSDAPKGGMWKQLDVVNTIRNSMVEEARLSSSFQDTSD